ncbi:radical SAM protein [Paraburkholderia edwinii]|uniref:Radical SAM protein n=1 Tax=Paraburkholderia edwinii TaxID=2861782 RepID=A0ABX8UMG8_9BURK|nr:radical SAM protein [Paraburkholderia edwinii]QYD70187.1 radical SAM protein [Paraburkholderia edwinii]
MRLFSRPGRDEAGCYVVIPARIEHTGRTAHTGHPRYPLSISTHARRLIQYIQTRASVFAPHRNDIWLVDSDAKRVLRLSDGQYLAPESLKDSGLRALVNPSFLLQDIPPFQALADRAKRDETALCAVLASNDYYGFAWRKNAVSGDTLWSVLRALTATTSNAQNCSLNAALCRHPLPPSDSVPVNSPALDGIEAKHGPRASDAPIHVNTAFFELLEHRTDAVDQQANGPEHMVDALLQHHRHSEVPWIFNALINEIEYRLGVATPQSFPPEIHLSLTGACNLECRFCAYTKSNAIYRFSDLEKIARLDFLRHVRTLRLSSGLGEPTLNKSLPEVIDFLARTYPQLGLNFFTNGIALHRPGLIESLLNQVRWINVSLNASNAESWKLQHQADRFDLVCGNLKKLKDSKRDSGALYPLVFGSMVLNGKNVEDLPKMPALCRELGIDRLTAFPYSALGYRTVSHTFGPELTLENFRAEYDAIYDEIVHEAAIHKVSLEIPSPLTRKKVRFGLEVRSFYDFAMIEKNEWQLAKLVDAFFEPAAEDGFCSFLWRIGCIGSTHKGNRNQHTSNYMYPCIGPLAGAELSEANPFDFPAEHGFSALWNNPVFTHLRAAQKQRGICAVCDKCRCSDSRDAETFPAFEQLVAEFTSKMDALVSPDQRNAKIIPLKVTESR